MLEHGGLLLIRGNLCIVSFKFVLNAQFLQVGTFISAFRNLPQMRTGLFHELPVRTEREIPLSCERLATRSRSHISMVSMVRSPAWSADHQHVLKMKIRDSKDSKDGKKFLGDPSSDKLQVIKQGSLKNKDLKRLTFYVREGANCRCSMLEERGNYLLVMGHRDAQKARKLFMTFVHSWQRTRDFRRKINALKDPDVCTNGGSPPRDRQDSGTSNTHAQNTQGAEAADVVPNMTPAADEWVPMDQTNSPMHDGVPPADRVMSDETPSTPVTTPSKGKRRKRPRKGKSKRREQREIEVRRAQLG